MKEPGIYTSSIKHPAVTHLPHLRLVQPYCRPQNNIAISFSNFTDLKSMKCVLQLTLRSLHMDVWEWGQLTSVTCFLMYVRSPAPCPALPCHLEAHVVAIAAKNHKIQRETLSAIGQTGAGTGPRPDAALGERV